MTASSAIRLASIAVTLAAGVVAAQQPTFRATAELVAVDVAVTRGRTPVPGLAAADFTILDNAVPQQIESVTRDTLPLDLTFVIDLSGSEAENLAGFMEAAGRMRASLREGDQWRWLGVFADGFELVPMQPATGALPTITRPKAAGMSALHDTVFLALVRPGQPARRHLVVVFTDGNDNWSMLDGRRLPPLAERADAVLHVVISEVAPTAGQGANRVAERHYQRWRASQDALFDAAQISGGSIQRLADRAAAFARIIEDFRNTYVVRYIPRGVDSAGWHELKVSLNRPGGFNIRARRGYER